MTPNLVSSWLLTYAIHSSLLLGLAWIASRWLHSPAVREALWKTAMVGSLVTATLHSAGFGARGTTLALSAPRSVLAPADQLPSTPLATGAALAIEQPNRQRVAAGGPGRETAPSLTAGTSWPLASILATCWSLGAGLLVLGFVVRRWQLGRRLGGRVLVRGHPAVEELAQLRRDSGVRREVTLTVCDRLSSPIAVGLSEVSVPGIALRELDGPQRRSMLAHEFAHLVRFDPLWLLAGALLERIFFFQPLNRLARRRIQADAELLCDAWAAERTGSGVTLAKCLVKVAEWVDAAPRPIPIAGMAEERSQLVDRVRRLVEEGPVMWKPRRRMIVVGVGALLLATAVVAPRVTLVGQDPVRRPSPKPRPSDLAVLGSTGGRLGAGPAVLAGGRDSRRVQDTTSAVVPALLEALKDSNADVRRAAAQSLGNIGDRRAVTGLIAALNDEDGQVREAATESLGNLEDPRSAEPLARRLADSVADVRRAAIHALSQLDGQVSADLFRPALEDADPEIRAAAANAVGELKDRRSTAALIRLIGDRNAEVRQAALEALGNLEDPTAVDAIAAALKDGSREVRQAALNALGNLDLESVPAGALDLLRDANAEVRRAAASLVGSAGEIRAVPSLKVLLNDPDADVREAAVDALSEIRDGAAIDALVTALKSSDPVVRRAAAAALGQRGEK